MGRIIGRLDVMSSSNDIFIPEWKMSAAYCCGHLHAREGSPCQDRVLTRAYSNGTYIIALADGAGSARFSQHGASLVVRRASDFIKVRFDEIFAENLPEHFLAYELVAYLQDSLAELALAGVPSNGANLEDELISPDSLFVECTMRDLSSTLLLVAIKGDRYISLHVGDGVICAESQYGACAKYMTILSAPDNGEFVNVTHFVTADNAAKYMRINRGRLSVGKKCITGFVLMSDGPEIALYNKQDHRPSTACSKLLAACRTMSSDEMQSSLTSTIQNVIQQRTDDDCSIVLIADVE